MPCRWRSILKRKDDRSNKGITKLQVEWVKAVDAKGGHLIAEIPFQDATVIYVEKFSRDNPHPTAVRSKPLMGEQEEIAIKPHESIGAEP